VSTLVLKAAELIDQFETIEVIVTKDLNNLDLATLKIPRLRKGEIVDLPLWIALELIKLNVVTLNLDDEITWLSRVHWREKVQLPKGSLALSSIPANFYSRIRGLSEFIKFARREGDVRIKQAKNFYEEIVRRRTHIIAELSFLERVNVDLRAKLAVREKALLSSIKGILEDWFKEVFKEW